MQVNVKVPEVDTKVDEESDTVKTSFGRCQMEGSVAVVVTFLGISPEIRIVRLMYSYKSSLQSRPCMALLLIRKTNYQLDIYVLIQRFIEIDN